MLTSETYFKSYYPLLQSPFEVSSLLTTGESIWNQVIFVSILFRGFFVADDTKVSVFIETEVSIPLPSRTNALGNDMNRKSRRGAHCASAGIPLTNSR
jgi:hypothetical protein